MKPLTMTIDLQVSDGTETLAREVLRIGTNDTRELLRQIDCNVATTALALLIHAQQRQLDTPPPADE